MSKETFDTLGNQKATNYALRADMSQEEFVKEVTSGLSKAPQYFPKNVLMNKNGYESLDVVYQRGIVALPETPPLVTASFIAANGPMAFATSFAPCAKLSNAAEKISGTVKSEFILLFSFFNLFAALLTKGFTIKNKATEMATPNDKAVIKSTFHNFFNPLSIK